MALCIYQLYKGQVVLTSHIGIVLTKGRSNMNDTCTICQCYIGIAYNIVALLMLLYAVGNGAVIERLVLLLLQILALIGFKNLVASLSQNRVK